MHKAVHFRYIYNDDDERLRVMAHYLESGVSDDKKVMFLVDTISPAEAVERVAGIVPNPRSNSNLTVERATETNTARLSERKGRAEGRPPDAS